VGLVFFPSQTASLVRPVLPIVADSIDPPSTADRKTGESMQLDAATDASFSTKGEEQAYLEAHKGHPKVYPIVAQCEGVDLHSTISPADLSAVLFHQASYEYGLVMTTELPDADIEAISNDNPVRVNHDQIEGEWLDADAMHLWRTSDTTDMDTSIDIGAPAGTTLRSPVTGTVVLVKDYMLYDEVPDVEIHIQPDGRPDLDVVLIHNDTPLVKAGDKVEAGVTEIAHVRDIATPLVDIQLAFYTPDDDPGNHSHVQVNDANYKDYREKRLEGAITV
jgi:biotin carboxyl carrier protein